MPTRLAVTVSQEAADTVVTLAGELDIISAGRLSEALSEEMEAGHARLIVEVEQLTFCDSMGVRLLVEFLRRTSEAGGYLKLAGVRGPLRRLLEVLGLDDAFPIYESVADALQS
ncbi:STAS domain-containing protein [Planotetraspora sp. GP83]|uniref:STAS domain-containing protein n=1 Tax=Planotetraspora sp. GP83 TaxID=3156264 RepID=UPI003511B7CA